MLEKNLDGFKGRELSARFLRQLVKLFIQEVEIVGVSNAKEIQSQSQAGGIRDLRCQHLDRVHRVGHDLFAVA